MNRNTHTSRTSGTPGGRPRPRRGSSPVPWQFLLLRWIKAILISMAVATIISIIIVGVIMGTAAHIISRVGSQILADDQRQRAAIAAAQSGEDAWTVYQRREAEARAAKERAQIEERERWQWQQTHPTAAQIREQRKAEQAAHRAQACGAREREQIATPAPRSAPASQWRPLGPQDFQ